MSHLQNLQFLNLEDVSKEEEEEINTILYRESAASLPPHESDEVYSVVSYAPPPFYPPHTQVVEGMRSKGSKVSSPLVGFYPVQYPVYPQGPTYPYLYPPYVYPTYPPHQVFGRSVDKTRDSQPPVSAIPITGAPTTAPVTGASAPSRSIPTTASPINPPPSYATPITGAPTTPSPISATPIGAPINPPPSYATPSMATPNVPPPIKTSNATPSTGAPIIHAPRCCIPTTGSPVDPPPSCATPGMRTPAHTTTINATPCSARREEHPVVGAASNAPHANVVEKPKSNPPLNAIKCSAPPPSGAAKPCKALQPADQSGAPQPVDQSGALQPANQSGAPQPADQSGVAKTPQPADQSGAPQPADQSGAPQPADQSGAPQPADQSGAPQSADPTLSSGESKMSWARVVLQHNTLPQSKVGRMAGPPQDAVISRPPLTPTNQPPQDPTLHRLAELLCSYELEGKAVVLSPRGLNNPSNYCYINAVLQALLASAPFYNLIKAVSRAKLSRPSLPVIDSMVEFVDELSVAGGGTRLRKERTERAQARREGGGVDSDPGVLPAPSFEPTYVYRMVHNSLASLQEARQQDAEEFLTALLNALNDEMLQLMKLNNCSVTNGEVSCDQDTSDWKEVINKGVVRATTRTEVGKTPLTEIFMGQIRSRVGRSDSESTDHIQPFYTLHLDVESCKTVEEALARMTSEREIEDSETTTCCYLDHLPLVLVLHLKCFHYSNGSLSKISRSLDYPVDLRLANKLVQTNKTKLAKGTSYKLFAVVYHDGKEATKGHYLSDVYHVGSSCWLRYDDAHVRWVSENHVLRPLPPRVPYLLFYRRLK